MYSVRKAVESDIEGLTELGKQLIAYEHGIEPLYVPTRNPEPQFRKYFRKHMKRKTSLVLIAELNKKPIGYLTAKIYSIPPIFKPLKTVEILDVFVGGKYRSRGIGKKLMKYAIEHYSKLGFRQAVLFVLSKNKNAEKFYKDMGFGEIIKELHKKI